MTNPMEAVAQVFADGQRRRAARANTAFRTLSRYERRIAREAAVMGYVLGRREGLIIGRSGRSFLNDGDDFPGDFQILQDVLEHCDTTSDNFPYLGAACDGRRRRITKARLWQGEETAG